MAALPLDPFNYFSESESESEDDDVPELTLPPSVATIAQEIKSKVLSDIKECDACLLKFLIEAKAYVPGSFLISYINGDYYGYVPIHVPLERKQSPFDSTQPMVQLYYYSPDDSVRDGQLLYMPILDVDSEWPLLSCDWSLVYKKLY